MSCAYPLVMSLLGLVWTTAVAAQTLTVAGDTTIAGQAYAVLPAEVLLVQLRRADADSPIVYRRTVFQGRLFAPAARLDTVRAALDLEDVRFLDEVALSHVVFLAPVHFSRATFEGGLSLQGARFQDTVNFSAARLHRHATMKQAVFLGGVDFTDSEYNAVCSFIGAQFRGGENVFSRTRFTNAAYFERAHFTAAADFQDAAFADIASFKETVWDRDVSFAGARFGSRALFWEARFAGASTFATARADGEISFNRAVFGGTASFSEFIFAQAARFAQVTFRGDVSFAGAYFRKEADFTGSSFNGDLLDLNAFFNHTLDLRHTRIPTMNLQSVSLADSTFATGAKLYLQQADFQQIRFRWQQLEGHLTAADTTSLEDLEPVYATLRRQLQRLGLRGDADACFVEWMERQRHSLGWTDPWRYGLEFFRVTTGYGTHLSRFAFSAAGCILLFGLLYRLGCDSLHPLGDARRPSLRDCFFFSLQTFIRGCTISWIPTGKMRLLVHLEAVVGWIYLAFFVAILLSLFS